MVETSTSGSLSDDRKGETDELEILVVDDDEIDRIAVHRALQKSDLLAQVEEAKSLSGARDKLRNKLFNCLILDYHLRDGTALQLLKTAGVEGLELPPVIMLTGTGSESIAVQLMKAGASDYLPKDELTPSRIAQSVRNALRLRSSEDALRQAYEDLELRVVERTDELATANRELRQEMVSRRKAEDRARRHLEQLAHVARLSTLGEMAAGLAHELNQPLGAIANYANGCLKRLEAGNADTTTLHGALKQVATQAERAGKIIHRLRSFVASHEPEVAAVDVNQVLREVVALQLPEANNREVRLEFNFGQDLPEVLADSIQLQQVALNLMRNAIEAMQAVEPEQRRLIISTDLNHGREVEVTVTDSGPGWDPDDLETMFEPFYTTTEGMGMGLAISRSIIEAHGGKLWATPGQDGGLSFHFTLSAVESPDE